MRGGSKRMDRYWIAAFKPKPYGCEQLTASSIQFCDCYFRDFVASLSIMGSAFSTSL
jgi:hypothetical protein